MLLLSYYCYDSTTRQLIIVLLMLLSYYHTIADIYPKTLSVISVSLPLTSRVYRLSTEEGKSSVCCCQWDGWMNGYRWIGAHFLDPLGCRGVGFIHIPHYGRGVVSTMGGMTQEGGGVFSTFCTTFFGRVVVVVMYVCGDLGITGVVVFFVFVFDVTHFCEMVCVVGVAVWWWWC